MRHLLLIAFISFFHSFLSPSYSQGCSDAGFCNLSSFKAKHSDPMDIKYGNQFKIGGSYGKADHKIAVYGGFLEYHKEVDSCSSIDLRFSYISQKNSLVTSSGPSDLFLNANWRIAKQLYLTTGCKLALTDGNADIDGQTLPMDFQHSLGTFDVILGFSYKIEKLQLFLAGQQPLNKSKNKFQKEDYPLGSGFRDDNYQSTKDYNRKGDILFRAAYPIAFGNNITITPSVLPIYHLGDDEYTNIAGEKEIIIDSKGLTLNANLFIDFSINKMNLITLSFGAPLVTRKVRPDGLTRKYVAGLEYAIRF